MKQESLILFISIIVFLPSMMAQPATIPNHHEDEIDWANFEEKGIDPLAAERLVNDRGESILDFIPESGIFLIPESTDKKVMAFDPEDGTLIDEFFFPGDDVNLITPIHLIWNFNRSSFLISDQSMRLVQQFSTDGVFEETFAPQGGENIDILDNIRGLYMKANGNLLVTVAGGANTNSVARFDTEGVYLGNFIDNNAGGLNSPWAIIFRHDFNDYLVSASGSSGVHRYDTDGNFISMFATDLALPQQMQELENGNILVVNFSAPSGVYEYQSDGTQIGYYGVVTGLRGVRELGDGNIMVTNSSGVHIINRDNQLIETVAIGQARHISFIQPMDMGFFNLNLEMNLENAGTVQGAGIYAEDHMVTVTATPNVFHEFINWTDIDGAEVSDQASFQFQMPAEDVTLTANFAMLDVFSVNFTVLDDSADEDPIEGASISIDGFEAIETSADGKASIILPVGSYTAIVTKQWYVAQSVGIVVSNEDIHVTVYMMDVILPPANVEVKTEEQGPGEALLSWVDPLSVVEFRYDDGVVDGQLGFYGTLNSVLGAVHFNNAIIEEVTWYLTSEGGPHSTVKVWVLGLDEEGLPDRNNIVYTAEYIPNTDNQWNSHTFSEPIEMPGGFFIGLSYNGFLGIATDDGIGEPWGFAPGTHYGVHNITDPSSEFHDITYWDYEVNFLLRAYGIDFGEVNYSKGHNVEACGPAPKFIPMDNPVDAGHPKGHNDKAFLGYNVYLNDALVVEELVETEYLFTKLPFGEHTAGVQTIYTTGASEIITADFVIDVYEYVSITFVVTDEDQVSITDAIITLDGVTYAAGHYAFENLAPGTYIYKVEREGFQAVEGQVTLEDDITIPIVLIEDIELFEVQFRVDLTNAILHGLLEGFDPHVHHIYITGSMIDWTEPGSDPEHQLLEWLTAEPMVYGITHHLEAGTYEYKFFSDLIGEGWDGAEWPGDPNRVLEVYGNVLVEGMFGPFDLDIIDLDGATMLLYPNPAHSILHIESTTEILDVRLVDLLGQVVFQASVNDLSHQLNVTRFNSGIYFIQLTTRTGTVTHRLQVTR